MNRLGGFLLWGGMVFLGTASASGQTDTLRLGGMWSFTPKERPQTTIPVPGFYVWKLCPKSNLNFPTPGADAPIRIIDGQPEAVYETRFDIPQRFTGKRLFLRFESVNFLCEISLNGQPIARHIEGYLPFEIDITDHVRVPSTGNILTVAIRYHHPDFLDASKNPLWPVGFYDNFWGLGITGDVMLIARNAVYIENIAIRTSVSQRRIEAVVSMVNADPIPHAVVLENQIEPIGASMPTWSGQSLTLPPRDTVEVSMSASWNTPRLWWPDDPFLYRWIARVRKKNSLLDERIVRFGFREFTIQGRHFYLNGTKTTLRGDNITIFGERQYWPYLVPTPSAWSTILDSMKALHFNVIRLHHSPTPHWAIDLCDEKGMLVIAESALMWRDEITPHQSPIYAQNGVRWLKQWVREYRNHPAIILWSAANEMYVWGQKRCSRSQLIGFAEAIRSMDPTRPIYFEGDLDLEGYAEIMSYHYIFGYPKGWPGGNLYTTLAGYLHATKPTSYGEFEWWTPTVDPATHVRRQGAMARACRIVGFNDIRPYRLDWTWHPNPNFTEIYGSGFRPTLEQTQWIANTFHPLAAFLKYFYENRFDTWTPTANEYELLRRTVVIFNDEREGTQLEVRINGWLGKVLSTTSRITVEVPLGERVERPMEFRIPVVASDRLAHIELCTYKSGVKRFSEFYPFWVVNGNYSPPQRIASLTLSRQTNGLEFTWPSVTRDQENRLETIDRYVVYRAPHCFTRSSGTDSFTVGKQTRFLDSQTGHFEDPVLNMFYRVKAVDNTGLASMSDTAVVFDYALRGTPPGWNLIALPIDDAGLRDAKTLRSHIGSSASLARWDPTYQGFQQYLPEVPSTNFALSPGEVVWVHCAREGIATFIGKMAKPQYVFRKNANASSFYAVMLPLEKDGITTASGLMRDIGKCNSVARWNPGRQGFDQYVPGVPDSDFSVIPGHPYLVHITDDVSWPKAREPRKASPPMGNPLMAPQTSHAPHLVWGPIEGWTPVSFRAFLGEKRDSYVTHASPGCTLTTFYWKVQCATFSEGWRAGEVLTVELEDTDGNRRRIVTPLTWEPADQAGPEELLSPLPRTIGLSLYPNPFNQETTISFSLDQPSPLRIELFNLLGQRLTVLSEGRYDAGTHRFTWIPKNSQGILLPSGIYLIRLQVETQSRVQKAVFTL